MESPRYCPGLKDTSRANPRRSVIVIGGRRIFYDLVKSFTFLDHAQFFAGPLFNGFQALKGGFGTIPEAREAQSGWVVLSWLDLIYDSRFAPDEPSERWLEVFRAGSANCRARIFKILPVKPDRTIRVLPPIDGGDAYAPLPDVSDELFQRIEVHPLPQELFHQPPHDVERFALVPESIRKKRSDRPYLVTAHLAVCVHHCRQNTH